MSLLDAAVTWFPWIVIILVCGVSLFLVFESVKFKSEIQYFCEEKGFLSGYAREENIECWNKIKYCVPNTDSCWNEQVYEIFPADKR